MQVLFENIRFYVMIVSRKKGGTIMEVINIKDGSIDIVLYLNKFSYYGYQYCGNTVSKLNSISFNLFKLSNDYKNLGEIDGYHIIYDNETGLKHYYKDGLEDLEKLFYNNGEECVRFLGNGNRIGKERIFRIKRKIITLTLSAFLLFNAMTGSFMAVDTFADVVSTDYSVSDIYDFIYSSVNLSEDEKAYLYNENFLTDVLAVINESAYMKEKYLSYFNNIDITGEYDWDSLLDSVNGYYLESTPSSLYVKEYNGLNNCNMSTVAHEYVHLCQNIHGYNVIIEACAEIISNEYFNNAYLDCYFDHVKLVKILMEIIGSKVIWEYNFTADFSEIEAAIKQYLTGEEYDEFLNDLTFNLGDEEGNKVKYDSLINLFSKIYMAKYNANMDDDIVINIIRNGTRSMLLHGDRAFVRYYFNHRYMNPSDSYYYDDNVYEYHKMSLEEAYDKRLLFLYATKSWLITEQQWRSLHNAGCYSISCDISNGEILYYRDYIKTISYQDYVDGNYLSGATIRKDCYNSSSFIVGDTVYLYLPRYNYLPPVNELVNNRQLVLKR